MWAIRCVNVRLARRTGVTVPVSPESTQVSFDPPPWLLFTTSCPSGSATRGPDPADGLRLENVGFTYPGADQPALSGINLHLKPGGSLALVGANGSGKTTLIKLITRLYVPTAGRILLDGRDLGEWSDAALRSRFGVIFQDFVRYQLMVTAPLPDADAAAVAVGRERFEKFVAQVGRQLAGGKRSIGHDPDTGGAA